MTATMRTAALISLALTAVCFAQSAVEPSASPEGSSSLGYSQRQSALYSLNDARPVREGELLFLKDHMTQADLLLKERLGDMYAILKEMLQEGDAQLKEQLVEGVTRLKEQLREGDVKLKEQLDEEEEWLKEKLQRTESRVQEQVAGMEKNSEEELHSQREDIDKLRSFVQDWTEKNNAIIASLSQKMTDLHDQLQRSDLALQSTREQVTAARAELQTTQDTLHSTQDEVTLTRTQLETEVTAVEEVEAQLQASRAEVRTLKTEVAALRRSSNVGDRLNGSRAGGVSASTFVRWGRPDCPNNTSLVYSGVVGGGWYDHTGGSSSYVCVVMDPEPDTNLTMPSEITYLYGTEYELDHTHHEQDAVCSVCRTSRATTLMVPATSTCPTGWHEQYKGHLMSSHRNHKHGTEYVCVDRNTVGRDGGKENKNGALLYHVTSQCGSLPCPPYVQGQLVTCVVCSL